LCQPALPIRLPINDCTLFVAVVALSGLCLHNEFSFVLNSHSFSYIEKFVKQYWHHRTKNNISDFMKAKFKENEKTILKTVSSQMWPNSFVFQSPIVRGIQYLIKRAIVCNGASDLVKWLCYFVSKLKLAIWYRACSTSSRSLPFSCNLGLQRYMLDRWYISAWF
jgi:hypothetical protein